MTLLYIILGLLLVTITILIVIYNKLVNLKNLMEEAWSGIDIQLKKRYDLIPNLVNTVKGASEFEQNTLEKVIKMRQIAINSQKTSDKANNEEQLTQGLNQLFAICENYPSLKANANYLKLQEQLTELEDTISKSRRYYNGTARNLNISIQSFPNNLIAKQLGFRTREYFEVETQEKNNFEIDL